MRDLLLSRRSMLAMSLAAAIVPARTWAQPGDPALVAALRAHFGYSAGFRGKFTTGVYRFDPNTVSEAVAQRAVALISERLGRLESRTLALIHHVGGDGHLRAWLFDSDGLQASSVSAQPYVHLGYLQRSLRINSRMATRVAVRRDGRNEASPPPEGPDLEPEAALAFAAEQLLGPAILAKLGGDRGRLLVLPAVDTGTAPLAALTLPTGEALVERFSVVVVPDIETLLDPMRVHSVDSINWRSALLIGNPDLSRDREYSFSPLPGAGGEIEEAQQTLGLGDERVFLGERATVPNFVTHARGYGSAEFIHMASHAIANERNPMDGSFVALTGGHLTGQLLRGDTFDAWGARRPVVVLSGCQTALGKVFDGGAYGLSRAFFAAGAAQTVSSLWNVDDQATRLLMATFVEKMWLGSPTEDALRSAQRAVAQEYGDDPGAWASFTVFGTPSRRAR